MKCPLQHHIQYHFIQAVFPAKAQVATILKLNQKKFFSTACQDSRSHLAQILMTQNNEKGENSHKKHNMMV